MARGQQPESAVAACRAAALLLAALAAGLLAAAALACPLVLERWILADHHLGSAQEAAAWGLALGLLVLAAAAGWSGWRLWARAARTPRRRLVLGAATLALTLLVAVGLGEAVVRLTLAPHKLLYGEAWWLARWLAAHREGEDARLTPYATDRYDAELGWTSIPDLALPGLRTNARGQRGAREVPLARRAGELRIVVVGDSFTFGEDVRDGEVWTNALERLLGGARVVNLAVHGYGTDQQLLRLRREGLAYAPDLVVVGFFHDNAQRNLLAFRDYAKPVFRLEDGGLRLENVPVPRPEVVRAWPAPAPRFQLGALLHRGVQELYAQTPWTPAWEVTRRLLDALQETVSGAGARLLVAYIPRGVSPHAEDAEHVVADWAAARGVAFLSLREAFLARPENDQQRLYDVHWTAFGHLAAAHALRQKILEDQLLEPAPAAR